MAKYVIAIDQGTTSSRVLLITQELKVFDSATREHDQISSQPGWVEHDPEQIFQRVVDCLEEVVARNNLTAENVIAIGITNQRETTVAFSKVTGKPYHNAIVWLDQRTASIVKVMKDKNGGDADCYRGECGLPINTYFSAVKMKWLLEQDAVRLAPDLILGTIDTWLIAKLTGLQSFVTDSSNASRTMLMDIKTLQWSEKMLTEFGIDRKWLPEIKKSSSDMFGTMASAVKGLQGVLITGVLGDQQAACLGHLLKPGEVKNTYGTGCFMLSNTGETPVQSKFGLLTTLCYRLGDKTYYALEGAVEVAGAAIQWAKQVGLVTNVKNIEAEALSVADCGDVYFVPAFQGIFSPYWRDDARGLLIGMSLNTTRGHLMRALLEAPCLRSTEVVIAMEKDSGIKINRMVVDGGMTVNDTLMQMQADFMNAEIVRKQEKEITSVGAAIAAGLHVGFWKSILEVEARIQIDKVFVPAMTTEQRDKKLHRWSQAVERSIGFGWV